MPARESITRTLTIAVAVALVCSALVSVAVYVLRPLQSAYTLIERNRAIVAAATGATTEPSEAAIVQAFLDLDVRIVNLAEGTSSLRDSGHAFDHWPLVDAGTPVQEVPVYLHRENGVTVRVVLPVHGRGMWSTIYGYVALEADANTIAAVVFHRHGETPGIGDRIQDPAWLATWRGHRIYDAEGVARLRVAKGDEGSDPFRIDLISGASVTSEATGRLVSDRFTEYGPWLERLREGAEQ